MGKKSKNNVVSVELESVEVSKNVSFKIGRYEHTFFTRPTHYHPEFELLLISKGYGTRIVGDHFEKFTEGDLVLLGANLPHVWKSDPHFFQEDNQDTCESIYIQFSKKVFGTQFIDIPELHGVRIILKKAEQGIKILGKHKEEITEQMKAIGSQKPFEQLLTLLRILDLIQYTDYETLASQDYMKDQVRFKSKKMMRIHNFIMQNFKMEIDINSCAHFVEMTPTSFCRFFKKHTNVTFSVYLNYIRINFAQKLICNTELPIKEIGYESGFNSIVYFNQIFKKLTGISPNEYRKRYKG